MNPAAQPYRWRYLAAWLLLAAAALAAWLLPHRDPRGMTLASNTLWLVLGTWLISLPAGTLLAIVLTRTKLPGRQPATGLIALLLFVPLYLQAAAWEAGFGLQGWLTLRDGPWLLRGWTGAIWVHGLAAIPWVVLIVGVGLRFVEPELEEEALLSAASVRVLCQVTLRRAISFIGVAAVWVAVTTAGEITVTDLYQVRTYAEELYTELVVEPGQTPLGVLPGVIVTAVLVMLAWLMLMRLSAASFPVRDRPPSRFALGPARWPLLVAVGLATLVLAGLPLANLIYWTGLEVQQTADGFQRGWSLGKALRIVAESPWRFRRELGWSLLLASVAATGSVVLGTLAAWLSRRSWWRAWPIAALTALSLAIPGPLVGLGLIRLFDRSIVVRLWDQPLDLTAFLYNRTILVPCLALLIRSLPIALLVMWFALRSLPASPLEAAASEGASRLGILCRIALPQRKPAIIVAWLSAFAIGLGELSATLLVIPPGVTTLSIRIFTLIHYGVQDQVAGICLAVVALMTAVAWIASYFARRIAPPG